ncbi:MAG TPA: DUF6600 domain-containing protein [Puia sp.]|nr:DUF6600 domain-containing protein [Puia sp.]
MKHNMIIVLLGIALFTGLVPRIGQVQAQAQTSVSFQVFYDQLSPYGTWVNYPDYGYVWVPAGGSSFRPYGTRGHWVYADEGWIWVSGYSWGWAPFHYGNWFYDDSYGWMWAPGYEWAPAWVTWGEYGGNYCWAPVGPRVDIGISFGSYRPPANYWTFCPRNRITSVNVSNYYVRNVHNTTVINNITVINNVNRGGGGRAYLRGPAPDNVARYTHTPIRPVAIRPTSRPGASNIQYGQLAIYRPTVQNNNNASARPSHVRDLHALRPMPGAHPAPGNNRPGGASPANRPGGSPGNAPGRTPQPANSAPGRPAPTGNHQPGNPGPREHQPANNPAPVHNPPPVHNPSPASRPSSAPADRPITPAGRPAPQRPAPDNNRTPVLQHNAPQPHPAVQPHPMPQQRPAPQPHPEPQPRPMPQQHPTPQPRPAPQQHPVQPPHPAPAPRPAPQPPHPKPGDPEHHNL